MRRAVRLAWVVVLACSCLNEEKWGRVIDLPDEPADVADPGGETVEDFSGAEQIPVLSVQPEGYVFTGATAAVPQVAEFTLSNLGEDVLVIASVGLESGNPEFAIDDPPQPDYVIDPGEPPLKVHVRYAPGDVPDTETLVVRSNDPGRRILRIPLEGR